MMKTFSFNLDEIDHRKELGQYTREVRGFMPYSDDWEYDIVTRSLSLTKLTATDKKIISMVMEFPLLTREAISNIIGGDSFERVGELYENGVLGRFYGRNVVDEQLSINTYFLAENAFGLLKSGTVGGFPAGSVEDMSVPMRLEVAVLSKWCAYTMAVAKRNSISLISYSRPDREHPYLEAVIHKTIKSSWRRGVVLRFHIMCRPKSQERLLPFMETLGHFNKLVQEEEYDMVGGAQKSYVVILCENDDNMEHFSVEINHLFSSRKLDDISSQHFLYSLEEDALDEMGSFKFLHSITFPDGSIRRQQVAFR